MTQPLLTTSSPALVVTSHRDTAAFAISSLLEQRPDVADAVRARCCVLVGGALPFPLPNAPLDVVAGTILRELDARYAATRVDASGPELTPLHVLSAHPLVAVQLRALRLRAPRGHFLGTCGAAEGGVIFVSNVDDTVIGSGRWDDAAAFVARALDELVGPALS